MLFGERDFERPPQKGKQLSDPAQRLSHREEAAASEAEEGMQTETE